ncbi:hypothetical protein AZKH_1414 [Azoarcus sp. KH32C]|nr:hypothetical protein AZKH_1414 [Azoarcus sp. KH32C]
MLHPVPGPGNAAGATEDTRPEELDVGHIMKTITKQDVVTELGISDRTLENWMRQKKFPTPVKFGKCGLRTAE